MKYKITITIIAISTFAAACSNAKSARKPESSKTAETKTTTTAAGSPSETVKKIYDLAIARNCSAIPPMLTPEFRDGVGTSKDSLDALCDSFTDSGKLTGIEVGGEDLTGDAGTVRVTQHYKDGRKETKDERMKKVGDKWLMDS